MTDPSASVGAVMPHDPAMRPVWMVRIGLFLYDHLARREWLPASTTVDLRRDALGAPLKPVYTRGFVYSDGWVDDARLVVLAAVDAAARGATILTRTRCESAERNATVGGPRCNRPAARRLSAAPGPWSTLPGPGPASSCAAGCKCKARAR